ncbi:hypothetical protein Asi03nite_03170 [Actinoplanes siamensis]|uniref:Uncharacterized protein n=1 Tax=Actinoplanes siamensis TaxID=1223317 RepID=A0A919KA22_9ACTN|nr:hypothetical protein Asi03nite_03170 [Actinoplanes siamensis]
MADEPGDISNRPLTRRGPRQKPRAPPLVEAPPSRHSPVSPPVTAASEIGSVSSQITMSSASSARARPSRVVTALLVVVLFRGAASEAPAEDDRQLSPGAGSAAVVST